MKSAPGARPGHGPRVLVYGLLAAIVLMSAFGAVLWPLNEWRLFSTLRTSRSSSLHLIVESPSGETRLKPAELWREYRGVGYTVSFAEEAGADELERVCDVLLEAARTSTPEATALRMERVSSVHPRAGPEAGTLGRQVIERCEA